MKEIKFFPLFLILIGIIMIFKELEIIISFWKWFWPSFFILLGIVMVLNSIFYPKNKENHH